MLIAQRDDAGDYVVRHNLPADELPAIQGRNLAVYEAEVQQVLKKHGRRCLSCNAVFAPLVSPLKDKHGVPLWQQHHCNTCCDLMEIFGERITRLEAEQQPKLSIDSLKKIRELHESLEPLEDEDDEELT